MIKYIVILLFSLHLSCNIFENEVQDFGVEKGYFLYDSDANKILWDRDRNFISIDFKEGISQDSIRKILDEYDLREYTSLENPNNILVKCLKMPAESYYSSFPIVNNNKLGNNSRLVDSVFPVLIRNENRIQLSKEIFIHFENLNAGENEAFVDSLIKVKNLSDDFQKSSLSGSYTVSITKESSSSPLEIANELTLHPRIKFSNPNYYFFFNN